MDIRVERESVQTLVEKSADRVFGEVGIGLTQIKMGPLTGSPKIDDLIIRSLALDSPWEAAQVAAFRCVRSVSLCRSPRQNGGRSPLLPLPLPSLQYGMALHTND
jgi:hypothetical protein